MGAELNHTKLFSFGFLVYWVIPMLIVVDDPLFSTPTPERVHSYWWKIAGIFACFFVGDFFGRLLKYNPKPARPTKGFGPLLFVVSTAFASFVVLKRVELFSGPYVVDASTIVVRGPIAALSMLLFMIAIVRMSSREEFDLRNIYFGMFLFFAVVYLATGGRMVIVTCCIALLIYYSCYVRRLKLSSLALMGTLGLLVFGAISIWRIGTFQNSVQTFFWTLATESYYTSLSLLEYLNHYHEPLIAFPSQLLADFYNLVPTFIAGEKLAFNNSFGVSSPFGALHSYVSWMQNFGIFGSFLFAIALGFWLRWLRARNTSISRPIYSVVVASLAMTFWRDDFSISVVKMMIENAILFSLAIYYYAALIAELFPKATFGLLPFQVRLLSKGDRQFRIFQFLGGRS